MSRRTITLAGAICLVLSTAAGGQSRDTWEQPGPQWAKLNVCGADQVGVRASLPGDGGGGRMAARFTLQWLNPETESWEPVDGRPVSPWIDAGPADVNWSQVGYTFELEPIPPGTKFTFRGIAELQLAGGSAETLTTPNTCELGV